MAGERFEIVVGCTLSPAVAAAVEGFTVERVERGRTHFVGSVIDQERLMAILERLRDLTIPIESVNRIEG